MENDTDAGNDNSAEHSNSWTQQHRDSGTLPGGNVGNLEILTAY